MPAAAENRISVVRGQTVVPLLPASSELTRAKQPWKGILLERHSIGAIEIPEHEHRDFCLHLQLSGTPDFEWWSGGKNRLEQTAPGSMILLTPGTRDRMHWQGGSARLILSLQPELLRRTAEELDVGGNVEFPNQWSLRDPAMSNMLTEMGKQSADNWPLGSLYADLLGAGLTNTLVRRYADKAPPAFTKGQLPLPKLRHAMEFITENLHRDLRLGEIAQEAGLSPFHFARMFRDSTGETPYQYLLDQRIARAKALLRIRPTMLSDVALETGFSSATNFVRAFRQRVGVTPKAWQGGK